MSTEKTPLNDFGKLVVDDIPAKDEFVGLSKDEVFVHRALGEHDSDLAKAAVKLFGELRKLSNYTLRMKTQGFSEDMEPIETIKEAPADQTIMQACSMLEHSLIAAKKVRKAAVELSANPEAI
jgi:hypothetical protein